MHEIYVVVVREEGKAAELLSAHPTEYLAKREREFFKMQGLHHMSDMEVECIAFSNWGEIV